MGIKFWRGSPVQILIAALLAGAIAPFAFSPFNVWPLMPLSMALLFVLLNGRNVRSAAHVGLGYGLGLYGVGVSWVYVSINQFGNAPAPLALVLTGLFVLLLTLLFFVPLAALFSRLSQGRSSWQKVLLFAGLWVLGEWLRSWLLTGFPWLFAGYTLLDTPFAGLAPVAGVYSLSLLVALFSAGMASLIYERTVAQYITLALAALLAVAGVALKGQVWTEEMAQPPLTFAAIQGNISQDLKWQPGHLDKTIDTYLDLTAPHWNKDLVFWPENAVPTFFQHVPGLMNLIEQQTEATNTAFILGVPWYADGPYYNSLVGLGGAKGSYFKQKLVPFGEYVPLEKLIRGLIAFFDLPMSSFSAGQDDQVGLRIRDLPVAAYICYEIVYPDFSMEQAENKGMLLTVSNDTWFGESIGPEQHFQMVRMRSLETGRYQLRVTNDGITALIDPQGDVVNAIPRYRSGVLEGEIPAMEGFTPFMRTGSWPVLLLALLLVFATAIPCRRCQP